MAYSLHHDIYGFESPEIQPSQNGLSAFPHLVHPLGCPLCVCGHHGRIQPPSGTPVAGPVEHDHSFQNDHLAPPLIEGWAWCVESSSHRRTAAESLAGHHQRWGDGVLFSLPISSSPHVDCQLPPLAFSHPTRDIGPISNNFGWTHGFGVARKCKGRFQGPTRCVMSRTMVRLQNPFVPGSAGCWRPCCLRTQRNHLRTPNPQCKPGTLPIVPNFLMINHVQCTAWVPRCSYSHTHTLSLTHVEVNTWLI